MSERVALAEHQLLSAGVGRIRRGVEPGTGQQPGQFEYTALRKVEYFPQCGINGHRFRARRIGIAKPRCAFSSAKRNVRRRGKCRGLNSDSLRPHRVVVRRSRAVGSLHGTTTGNIVVQLLDANGNSVSGKTVSLSAQNGSPTITPSNTVTNSSGQAVFSLKDATIETPTITATDTSDGVELTSKPMLPFVALPAASGGINAAPPASSTTA